MKKVLMITWAYAPHIGGVERHTEFLAKELVSRGYDVTVLTKAEYHTDSVEGGIRVVRFPGAFESIVATLVATAGKYDIIHCHDFHVYSPAYHQLAEKVYITFHGWEGACPPAPEVVAKRQAINKACNGSICIGDFIEEYYGTKPDMVLYGGVREVPSEPKQELSNVVTWVGRIAPDTSALAMIASFVEYNRIIGGRLILNVCGGGSQYAELVRQVGVFGLSAWVKLHGFVADPTPFINGADVVMTTGYLSMLESFMAQRPVFSYYENPLKCSYLKPLREYASLFDHQPDLVGFFMKFYEQPQVFIPQVARAYQFAKNNTWPKVADAYEELWKK